MADITVSTTIDTFMQAADAATARTALGVTDLPSVTPQVVLSIDNATLDLDYALGSTVKHTLTNDIYSINMSNVVDGDSGLIILRQDGNGPWILAGDGYISGQLTSQRILAGDLASIATMLTSEVITLGWFYDGQVNLIYYYVSDISVTPE